jgi:hypothetical protein
VTHLRQAMLDELQRRNYAKTTVQYYIQAVERDGPRDRARPRRRCGPAWHCRTVLGPYTTEPPPH